MAADDPHNLERIDQEIRINELRERAKELLGGEMHTFEGADDLSPDVTETFLEQVIADEDAPLTTGAEQLAKDGVPFPPPEELDDAQVTEKLWVVIRQLARRRVFVTHTNHLSDRELYAYLWRDGLREEDPMAGGLDPEKSKEMVGGYFIDPIGSGSAEHTRTYLRFYADEKTRRRWKKDWYEGEMPEREKPPYDRDRHLPKSGLPNE